MTRRTIAAHQLRAGHIVIPDHGHPQLVTLARCEGAPPHVVVHWAGITTRTLYPAGQPVTIEVPR